MNKITAAITAVGGYVPDYVLTNKVLETLVDTNEEWILSRTGIKERRILKEEGKATSYLAIKAAQEAGLDLVEISPQAKPPVCKIMDFGKYKYELKKKAHEVKKKQKTVVLKEIKLRPAISSGDLDIKIKQIKAFLEEGHKVKISITFRGREIVHSSIGRQIMNKILTIVGDIAKIDIAPKFEGNTILTFLSFAKALPTKE